MSRCLTTRLSAVIALLGLISCGTKDADGDSASGILGSECDEEADADGDGVDDCLEAELGTDPSLGDSDGDGMSDGDEFDCESDPLDELDVCYGCGWSKNDPGSLESSGDQVGDVIDNIVMVDQCGDDVSMWDFYGEYHIIYKTAAW